MPRARTVPAELLMEQLFRQTDLEVRLPLNLNVLDAEGVPRVMSLAQVLAAFLEHRMVVLIRRSRYRLGKIADRLEVLGAYRIAYLNLDEVIRIIREEDEPKVELMRTFELTEAQAEAILNMRLRNLRRLEEQTLAKEERQLKAEQRELERLLKDESRRRAQLKAEIEEARREVRRWPARRAADRARRAAGDRRPGARGAGRAPAGDRGLLAPGLAARAAAAISRTTPSSSTRKATARASCSRPRPPTSCC